MISSYYFLVLFDDTIIPEDILYTYLSAWTKRNQSLTNANVLHHFNNTLISIMYSKAKETLCLTTKGMPWQDLLKWKSQECTNDADDLMLLQQSTRSNNMPASSYVL